MGSILLAKINDNGNKLYKFIDTESDKIYTIDEKQALRIPEKDQINFRLAGNGKKITSKQMRTRPSIIENGTILEARKTLYKISPDGNIVTLINADDTIENVYIQEYLKIRSDGINNEHVLGRNGERIIIVKSYDASKSEVRIQLDEDKSTKETDNEGITDEGSVDPIKNDNFDIKEEIERVGNLVTTDKIIENTAKKEEDTKDINDYRNIIWNMYPNDRITIPTDEYEKYSSVILRVLDSDIEDDRYIALSKIFKQERTRCTFALILQDKRTEVTTIQVLGQSDVPEKALEGDLEEICIKYASWLRSTKYVRVYN